MSAAQHIYFLVHRSRERFKVGTAVQPVRRWAQIQPHEQTDFAESLVFDLDPGVSVSWAERTIHRALEHAHLDMPRDTDGHSEWFDYGAFEKAREFAREHRELLGIGEGYSVSLPQGVDRVAPARGRAGRRAVWGGLFDSMPSDVASINADAAVIVEEHVDRWLASGGLIGAIPNDGGLHVYFDQARISFDEVRTDSFCVVFSALSTPEGPMMRGRIEIFGEVTGTGSHIRVTVNEPFGLAGPLDTVTDSRCLRRGRTETWEETTPGAERVRAAIGRLVAAASPLDPTNIDAEIESTWKRLGEW